MPPLLNAINHRSQLPKDADEWLRGFIAIADTVPACIVISDMTISGCPMVFVNNEFCRVEQYSKADATGRNCRFLQGGGGISLSVTARHVRISSRSHCLRLTVMSPPPLAPNQRI